MNDYVETEVKLYVPNLEAVKTRLETLGAALVGERVFEHNLRYENAARTLAASGVVLRLRQDSRARLTYKDSGVVQDGIISRFEAEVEVSDFDTMDVILRKLGYSPQTVYEKYRTTYHLDGAEIVLDELPYGSFVEIETGRDRIEACIERLNLTAARRLSDSYLHLFAVVRRNLGLTFEHLTFANFAGISVPEEAFNS